LEYRFEITRPVLLIAGQAFFIAKNVTARVPFGTRIMRVPALPCKEQSSARFLSCLAFRCMINYKGKIHGSSVPGRGAAVMGLF
jgi:hypothetical protein